MWKCWNSTSAIIPKSCAWWKNLKESIEKEDFEKTKILVKEMVKFEKEIDLDYVINDVGRLLQYTQRGIESIQKIIMDLRTFVWEDRDTVESVQIEDVIDSVLSIVHNEIKRGRTQKELWWIPLVRCNAQRLGQVFINLLVNAVQAIEEKGVIEIITYTQDKYVCIDVSDTGKGISPENQKRIFEPFFTTKPIGQGTGLGLSVSYEILKKYNGQIKVKSTPGKGTVFTVMLPGV